MAKRTDRRTRGPQTQAVNFRITEIVACIIGSCRLEILYCLRNGPRSVTALASTTELATANISHHLGILYEHGLVTINRVGTRRYYQLTECIEIRAHQVSPAAPKAAGGSGDCAMISVDIKGTKSERATIVCQVRPLCMSGFIEPKITPMCSKTVSR